MSDTTLNGSPQDTPRSGPSGLARFFASVALLRESRVGMIGAGLVLIWVFMALLATLNSLLVDAGVLQLGIVFPPNATFAPIMPPFSEFIVRAGTTINEMPVEEICSLIASGENEGSYNCGTFWLGTDHLGRDIWARIFYGSQTVLTWAPIATLCAYAVGIPMGLAAGYKGGWVDDLLSFLANVILSFPVLVLFILFITLVGASAINIVVAITFASAPGIMRIVRGLTLDLRTREYVFAAQTRGEPTWWILFVEILPNARGPLIVDSMLRLGYVIITIGVLGFLGLGLPPPDPDWGGMINETRQMAMSFPWMTVFPCLAISSLVLGFNLLADGLREVSMRD
ncbi:ABC transporter permease [Algihabitans albus]|uniref:ABC transporter permease n=1 Tax=Algihabitans albus TaxID=2164067 RepID=UPI0035D0D5D4